MRTSRFGSPLGVPRSAVTVQILEPTAGFSLAQPPTDLQAGQTPTCTNWLMREGGLELRPTLSDYTANAKPVPFATGGFTVVSSVDSHFPFVSGTTSFAYYSAGSWSSPLSYVSAGGRSTPPSGLTTDYFDMIQSYAPTVDENVALMANYSYQTLFTWASGSTVYSSITSAPRARFLAPFDNFVLAFNIRDVGSAQSKYVQRVQWSDRGDPLNWVFGGNSLAGFEDLLAAKGQGTRIMPLGNRVILFFEDEIWQAVRATGVTSFAFEPVETSIGCPFSWTVTSTPLGLIFLGRDLMLYLLPVGGGSATPIGSPVRRFLQGRITNPDKAWGVWDQQTNTFRLYFAVVGGTGIPQEAVYLNLGENSWAPQSFVHSAGSLSPTRGFIAINDSPSGGLTWNQLTGKWNSIQSTWATLQGQLAQPTPFVAVGTSSGSMYFESNGTQDGALPITAIWRSQALGGDSPGVQKVLQQVRVDYNGVGGSMLTLRASRDQGATFDPALNLSLPATPYEGTARGFCYVSSPYPTFEIQSSSNGQRIFRFWAEMRNGGYSA